MNFSLLSRVQSFLQVLTATLIFSPFCNNSDFKDLVQVSIHNHEALPSPRMDYPGTTLLPANARLETSLLLLCLTFLVRLC